MTSCICSRPTCLPDPAWACQIQQPNARADRPWIVAFVAISLWASLTLLFVALIILREVRC